MITLQVDEMEKSIQVSDIGYWQRCISNDLFYNSKLVMNKLMAILYLPNSNKSSEENSYCKSDEVVEK